MTMWVNGNKNNCGDIEDDIANDDDGEMKVG